jgi:hypothetical protein
VFVVAKIGFVLRKKRLICRGFSTNVERPRGEAASRAGEQGNRGTGE